MRPELFRLFGIGFPSYFVLLLTGFLFATASGAMWAKRIGRDPDVIVDLGLAMLLAGVVGSRILHVLADGYFWDYVHLCTDPAAVLRAPDADARAEAFAQLGTELLGPYSQLGKGTPHAVDDGRGPGTRPSRRFPHGLAGPSALPPPGFCHRRRPQYQDIGELSRGQAHHVHRLFGRCRIRLYEKRTNNGKSPVVNLPGFLHMAVQHQVDR